MEYGKEMLHKPEQLLGLISDYAPEQETERWKLKLLFDIGAVDILNEGGNFQRRKSYLHGGS